MKVYCVYAYVNDSDYPYVEKIFSNKEKAEKFLEEENKKAGWARVTCIDEKEIE